MSLTTDRNNPCLNEIREDGQQECYLVLSEEERAKGFVRPVRQTYRHITCNTDTHMGLALAETYARQPSFYGGTFCVTCGTHFPLKIYKGIQLTIGDEYTRSEEKPIYEHQFQWIVNGAWDGSFVGE